MGGGLIQLVGFVLTLALVIAAAVAIWAAAVLIHAAYRYAQALDDRPNGLANGDWPNVPSGFTINRGE